MTKRKPVPTLSPEALVSLRDDALKRQADIIGRIKQLQATGQQLVGELNQVVGEIKALDQIMGAK